MPTPGSPAMRTTEPGTRPPPRTRESSWKGTERRGWSLATTWESSSTAAGAEREEPRAGVTAVWISNQGGTLVATGAEAHPTGALVAAGLTVVGGAGSGSWQDFLPASLPARWWGGFSIPDAGWQAKGEMSWLGWDGPLSFDFGRGLYILRQLTTGYTTLCLRSGRTEGIGGWGTSGFSWGKRKARAVKARALPLRLALTGDLRLR